jgi:hypothetical protein
MEGGVMDEPVVLVVRRFKCPHCDRSWSRKSSALGHMKTCWRNPNNRSCMTCTHRIEPDSELGYDTLEDCGAGVDLPRNPNSDRGFLAILPLHCPKWEVA